MTNTTPSLESYPRFIQFEPLATKGALYVPDGGAAHKVAFLPIHRVANFMSLICTRELSARGFMVLGMNPRSDNNEARVKFENVALDIKQGIEFLRNQPGIEKVVLIGHSGGGPATTFYQAVAENGTSYCQDPRRLYPVTSPAEFEDLPGADGLLLLDAHSGNTVNTLRNINPAVMDEDDPHKIDSSLDPFSSKNGFNPEGSSTYSDKFMDHYFTGQADRMNRLIDKALATYEEVRQGRAKAKDDVPFVIYHTKARLVDLSTSVNVDTRKPRKLLRNDGSIVTGIVKCVHPPSPHNSERDRTLWKGSQFLTVRSFLSAHAIRAKHSMDDIDWQSSNNSTTAALQVISVPLLVAAMGAHYFIRDDEQLYEAAASKDKDYIVAEGATHGMEPCEKASKITGVSYSNVTKNLYDYVADWARQHFD